MVHRILSLAVALFYLGLGCADEGLVGALKGLLLVALPLAMIWFGDLLGDYLGFARWRYVSRRSPGFLVAAVGWALLLLPLLLGLVLYLSSGS